MEFLADFADFGSSDINLSFYLLTFLGNVLDCQVTTD